MVASIITSAPLSRVVPTVLRLQCAVHQTATNRVPGHEVLDIRRRFLADTVGGKEPRAKDRLQDFGAADPLLE